MLLKGVGPSKRAAVGDLLTWDAVASHANVTLTNNNLDMSSTASGNNALSQGFDPTKANQYIEFEFTTGIETNLAVGAIDAAVNDEELQTYIENNLGDGFTQLRRGAGGGNDFNWYMRIEGQLETEINDGVGGGAQGDRFGFLIHNGHVWVNHEGTWLDVTNQSDANNRVNPRNTTPISGNPWFFAGQSEGETIRMVPDQANWAFAPTGAVEIRV